VRKPLGLWSTPTLLRDIGESPSRQNGLPARDFGAEAADQPTGALDLVPTNDRTAMRQGLECEECTIAAIKSIDVDILGPLQSRHRTSDGAQEL